MKLLFIVLIVFGAAKPEQEYVTLKYDNSLMAAISDAMIWQDLDQDVPGSVQLITSEYYDTHIVSRWTSEWLAGDTTWLIGFTQDFPYKERYVFGLIGRTMHILSKHYAGNPKIRFGLVDYTKNELLKMTVIADTAPAIAMLKDGKIIRLQGMREAYHEVHEFIEVGQFEVTDANLIKGRWTSAHLYWSYFVKDVRSIQEKEIATILSRVEQFMGIQCFEGYFELPTEAQI